MQIIIAGDLVPTKSNIELFNSADLKMLLGEELLSIWNSVDVRIFNLEVPLSDRENPIDKWGPNLIAPISTIEGIKALNPSLITLANNHIFDQGINGLKSTKKVLQEYGIPFVGIGDNVIDASKPYIIKQDEFKIGVYACAEHEFSIATDNTPGANPFDPLESLDHIQNLKFECNYVIVLYHGGKEHYRYPSPYLQKVCRKMVEKGADLVVCQHSHCIGSYEKYRNSTIIYGQGNFIFDNSDNEYWRNSLLIKIEIGDHGIDINYIPIIKESNVIRLASKEVGQNIIASFQKRSMAIMKSGFVEEKYKELAGDKIESYLREISGMGKWVSRFDRYLLKSKILKHMFKKKRLLVLQNYIECEAHRELILAGLKGEIISECR
jgi:poly-gamma-glutamate synthesis protein (capsule biosynthesis protein)